GERESQFQPSGPKHFSLGFDRASPHHSRRSAKCAIVAQMPKAAMTRRELLAGGLAFAAGHALSAVGQFGGVTPTPPLPNPRYPLPPTWETELKEIAPGVCAYIQAGGPGRDNASVANAGIVVGDDSVLVIDTLTAPLHAKSFISAIRRVTDKPFRHVVYTH